MTIERERQIGEWLDRAGHKGSARETYRDVVSQAPAQFDSVAEMVRGYRAAREGWPVYFKHSDGRYYTPDEGADLRDDDMAPEDKPAGRALAEIADDCGEEWLEIGADEDRPDEDEARQRIEEDALSVEIRSDWYAPDEDSRRDAAMEYRICLCTGGPAVQIVGDLVRREPGTARLQAQGWFLPWLDVPLSLLPDGVEDTLLAYAQCFYFGD